MRKFLTLDALSLDQLATKLNKEIEKKKLINPRIEILHQIEPHHSIQMIYSFDIKDKDLVS